MSYRFAIIGGGWYGCHIAASLKALGFAVTLFEQHERLLNAASGNNQFRLHQGFHYPRHYGTRMQSRDGFLRFVERYPSLTRPVENNYYAVPKKDSLIDYLTYRMIMTSSGIEFSEVDIPPFLTNLEGCLCAAERVMLTDKARRYFNERLGPDAIFGYRVTSTEVATDAVTVDGERYDFLVDATWGHYSKPPVEVFFEPTLLLYYEAVQSFPAVTMVDGPLCSVYPTEHPKLFTLSSVPHTPIGQFDTAAAANHALGLAGSDLVAHRRELMEQQVRRYIPQFDDMFRFVGPQFSMKTKPLGAFDDRSCHVFKNGRMFSVMSGKIDTIFFAVERILSLIEAIPDMDLSSGVPESYDDLLQAAWRFAPKTAS